MSSILVFTITLLFGTQFLAERCVTVTRNILLLSVLVLLILALKSYESLVTSRGGSMDNVRPREFEAFKVENNLQNRSDEGTATNSS